MLARSNESVKDDGIDVIEVVVFFVDKKTTTSITSTPFVFIKKKLLQSGTVRPLCTFRDENKVDSHFALKSLCAWVLVSAAMFFCAIRCSV